MESTAGTRQGETGLTKGGGIYKRCSRLCRTYELKPLNALIQTFYSLCPYSFYYKADKIYKTLQSPKSN